MFECVANTALGYQISLHSVREGAVSHGALNNIISLQGYRSPRRESLLEGLDVDP